MQGLGTLPGQTHSRASDISADGSIVVGFSGEAGGTAQLAFRWTYDSGIVGIDPLTNDIFNRAYGIAADGSSIVGASIGTDGFWEAFLWNEGQDAIGLGSLPGHSASEASGISADGSTVIGSSVAFSPDFVEAFRWSSSTGMFGLGHLPGHDVSIAEAISADGSVIVGRSYAAAMGEDVAFIWDQTNGMRRLSDVLMEQGLDLSGWKLRIPSGVSYDGTVIVGTGYNPVWTGRGLGCSAECGARAIRRRSGFRRPALRSITCEP